MITFNYDLLIKLNKYFDKSNKLIQLMVDKIIHITY